MKALHYSTDREEGQDYVLQHAAIPRVLFAIEKQLLFAPLFPLLTRLVLKIKRPRPLLEDLLRYIPSPSSNLRFLFIEFHARDRYPPAVLDFISRLSEYAASVVHLKLKLYGQLTAEEPSIDLFVNSNRHVNLRVLSVDCAYLSPLSFSRIAYFPALRHLEIRLESPLRGLRSNLIASLSTLVRLSLRVTETSLAIDFFGCIGNLPQVTHITTCISQSPPSERELGEIARQIHRSCCAMSFKHLKISFNNLDTGATLPAPSQPSYDLRVFLPLASKFSLCSLNLSIQLPLFPPRSTDVAKMASAWVNLTSIKVDSDHLIPSDHLAAVSICNLVPFLQTCSRLRQLYIPFKHLLSEHLPTIHARHLFDLGVGYMLPGSDEASTVARWLHFVAPRLPEMALADASGEVLAYDISELMRIDEEEDSVSEYVDSGGES